MQLSSDASFMSALVIIFSTGFLSGLSPCTLPTAIFVVAYVGGDKRQSRLKGLYLSLFFVLGIASIVSLLGVFAGGVGGILTNTKVMNYAIAAILIIMGLWLLKVLEFNIADIGWKPKKGSGALGAFLLGLPFGVSASPCTMPIMISVLAYSATSGNALTGALFMFTYAIGRSIPLLLVGTFTGLMEKFKNIADYQEIFEKISGIILILLAVYFIWIA